MRLCWGMAQKYSWATPDRVMKLSYPQLRTLLMKDYEEPYNPLRSPTILMTGQEVLEYERAMLEKQKNVIS